MEIKFNKDKTVTISATESEYNVIVAAITTAYKSCQSQSTNYE